jgi:hypothetical protein
VHLCRPYIVSFAITTLCVPPHHANISTNSSRSNFFFGGGIFIPAHRCLHDRDTEHCQYSPFPSWRRLVGGGDGRITATVVNERIRTVLCSTLQLQQDDINDNYKDVISVVIIVIISGYE